MMELDLYIKDEIAPQAIILQLEGVPPPSGYVLTNTIEAWGLSQKNEILNSYDYDVIRCRLRGFLDAKTNGWADCSDTEKLILISFYLYNQRRTVSFTGTGIDDLSVTGVYSGGTPDAIYEVVIDDVVANPNTFKWKKDGGEFTTRVAITGGAQLMSDGVSIEFEDSDDHTLDDSWVIDCINNNSGADKVGFLMSNSGGGMSQADAISHIKLMFATSHKSSVRCCLERINAEEILTTVASFLSDEDAVDCFRKMRNLQIDFREQAILGSRWGNSSSGLGDFIMGIGGYVNSGLPSHHYAILNGGSLSDLQAGWMNVLFKGFYTKD